MVLHLLTINWTIQLLFINGHRQTTGTNPMELSILVNNSIIETGYATSGVFN